MESPRLVVKDKHQQRKILPRPSVTSLDQILNLNENNNGKRKWSEKVVPIKTLNLKRNRNKVNPSPVSSGRSSKSALSSLSCTTTSSSDNRESKRPKTVLSTSNSLSSSNSRSRTTVYKLVSRSPSSQTSSSESSNDFDDFQKPRAIPRKAVSRLNKYKDNSTSGKSKIPLCSKSSSKSYLSESPSSSMPRKRSRLYLSVASKVDCRRSSSDESKSSTKKKSIAVKKSIKKNVVRRLESESSNRNNIAIDNPNICSDNSTRDKNSEGSELEAYQTREYFRLHSLVKTNDELVCGVLSPEKKTANIMECKITKNAIDKSGAAFKSDNRSNCYAHDETSDIQIQFMQTNAVDNKNVLTLSCDTDDCRARSTSSFYSEYNEERSSLNTSTCSLKSENLSSECESGANTNLTSSAKKLSQVTSSPQRDPTTPKSWTTNRSFFLRATENRRKLHKREWESKKTKLSSDKYVSSRHKDNSLMRELTDELNEARDQLYLQENEIQSLRLEIEWARDGAAEDDRTRLEADIEKARSENDIRLLKARIEELEQQLEKKLVQEKSTEESSIIFDIVNHLAEEIDGVDECKITNEDHGYFSMPRNANGKCAPETDNTSTDIIANSAPSAKKKVQPESDIKKDVSCQTLSETMKVSIGCQADILAAPKQSPFKELVHQSRQAISNNLLRLSNGQFGITKSRIIASIPYILYTNSLLNGEQENIETVQIVKYRVISGLKKLYEFYNSEI